MGPPDGFLHRFLARGGPRVHHLTFKVPSLDAICARAASLGYGVVGIDRSDPHWQEAFLHPKQAQGIVVQIVESQPRPDEQDWPEPKPRDDAARVRGLRLSARSGDAARRQWGELLGGAGWISGDALLFRWPESPLVVLVDVDPAREEGPRWIELDSARDLALPDGPYPGARHAFRAGSLRARLESQARPRPAALRRPSPRALVCARVRRRATRRCPSRRGRPARSARA